MRIFKNIKKNLEKKYNTFNDFFMLLIFKGIIKEKFIEFPSSLAGHYNLMGADTFYKIAVKNKSFFKEEAESIVNIIKKYLQIGEIIPEYEYKSFCNNTILLRKSAILEPIENEEESYKTAEEFLKIFRKNSLNKSITSDEMPYLKKGLDIIKCMEGEEVFQKTSKLVDDFLQNNLFNIGFCHGDFHSKNLMKNSAKKYMIDLDCIREKSVQELDAIYFLIQKIIDDTPGIWWYEASRLFIIKVEMHPRYKNFLTSFLDVNKISLFILIYFLDRIGQDSKYLNCIDELPKREIVKTLKCLIIER